ncbi:hypothetical protein GBAR_LOCUS9196 [Geodia barretti]|uniref:VWFA domain-containing protein n=1 Tax=Geodia barretti TaxID=519541 RepID=A0AA35WBU0_GEOBA|nr:hypothetical protein GBAR_LOCUS9196 [Geodia barretti]
MGALVCGVQRGWRLEVGCWVAVLLLCSARSVLMFSDTLPCSGGDCHHTNDRRAADAGQCQVPDSSPLRIGESLFHSSQIMRGTEAVDLCLVISTVSSMSNSQLWLQIAVPVLDGHLLTLGIGNGDLRNRYCLVTFGGNSATKFIRVNGETFFSYNQFFLARRQLSRSSGTTCDGYEAINFTISNAPFREHPNVAKVIVLVTDSDRTRPSTRSDLTRDVMLQTLYTRHIALDTVVSISLQLSEQRESTVLGFHGYRKASILRPDGGYEMSQNQSVRFTYAMGQTISDYVALSLALESSSWPLGLLDNEDYNTILSFANAFANAHGLFPALPVEVCEECRCGVEATLSCEQPVDQELCRCLINQTHSQCGVVAPTPTATYVTAYLAPTSTPVPVAMEMSGHVTSMRGDTVVFFSSNRRLATYQCILMPDRIENPIINPCTSPYHVNTPTPGRYSILVLGRNGDQEASLLLWFQVNPSSGRLDVSTIQQSIAPNASVLVTFAANRVDVEFQCSTGDAPFQRCTSPYRILPRAPGVREDVFIVLATDSNGKAAASVLKIDDPTISPPTTAAPGPVMIEVWAKLPDPDGVLRICFRPTRNDVTCICQIDSQGPGILCESTKHSFTA